MTRSIVVLSLLSAAVVLAQAPPQFEVASIRSATGDVRQTGIGIHIDGSQVRIASMSLIDCIRTAYRAKAHQVIGPDWLNQPRFDIAAKIPDGVSPGQVPEMLQALLTDRFQLKMHRDSRELPVYALRVDAGGSKLTESAAVAATGESGRPAVNVTAGGSAAGIGADLGGGSSFAVTPTRFEIHRMAAAQIADLLGRLSDRPVVDETGLTGTYDMALDLAPDEYQAILMRTALNNGVVLPPQALRLLDGTTNPFSEVLQKVGLTLVAHKASVDVVIVDSILKTPSEN